MDLKRKLSSRKFWALIVAVATCSMVLFGMDAGQIEKVVALIGAVGSVIGYMFAEAYVDGQVKVLPEIEELIQMQYKEDGN